ncbi:MAG TPA: N-acetylneuraminate synthase family protein [Mycobacteriales bacterium]|nr:N-acetylneuraminate synthase family protein [Mycobacteriales bacterium]
MTRTISIGDRVVGDGWPVYVIAEIGINHNGSIDTALELMRVARDAGCDAVKFQKRTPQICVPPEQQGMMRETPWGSMTYLEYKEYTELGEADFQEIDNLAQKLDLQWFASPWDVPSLEFLERFAPVCHKIASASVTDEELVSAVAATGRPVIMSTGMSTVEEIDRAVALLGDAPLALAHATSTYPCPPSELNLAMISTLRARYGVPIGYSGHETGLQTTVAAVALGATFVERHITLDRASWGSDHAASVEPGGLTRLVRDIRTVESAVGDGVKRVYDSELPIRAKLRRVS